MGAKAELPGFNCFDHSLAGSLAESAVLLPPRALASAPGMSGRGLSPVPDPVAAARRPVSAGQNFCSGRRCGKSSGRSCGRSRPEAGRAAPSGPPQLTGAGVNWRSGEAAARSRSRTGTERVLRSQEGPGDVGDARRGPAPQQHPPPPTAFAVADAAPAPSC